jgi:hypothetical protein
MEQDDGDCYEVFAVPDDPGYLTQEESEGSELDLDTDAREEEVDEDERPSGGTALMPSTEARRMFPLQRGLGNVEAPSWLTESFWEYLTLVASPETAAAVGRLRDQVTALTANALSVAAALQMCDAGQQVLLRTIGQALGACRAPAEGCVVCTGLRSMQLDLFQLHSPRSVW